MATPAGRDLKSFTAGAPQGFGGAGGWSDEREADDLVAVALSCRLKCPIVSNDTFLDWMARSAGLGLWLETLLNGHHSPCHAIVMETRVNGPVNRLQVLPGLPSLSGPRT